LGGYVSCLGDADPIFLVFSQFLVEVSFSELAECLSFKLDRFFDVLFKVFFNGLPSDGFSTYSPW